MNGISKPISNFIFISRFPLIVMVIFIHAKLGGSSNMHIYSHLVYGVSDVICRIAVPLFFIISGFLFFINTECSIKNWIYKVRIRIRTILIPYVIWNLLALTVFAISELFLPSFRSGVTKPILEYSFLDVIYSLWDTNLVNNIPGTGEPICFQFWFLRDLMISIIFVPFISLILNSRILEGLLIFILAALWLTDVSFSIPGFSTDSFFFFYLGLFLFKYRISLMSLFRKNVCIISLLLYSFVFVLIDFSFLTDTVINKIEILIGIVAFVSLAGQFDVSQTSDRLNSFLSKSSFFLYASHGIILTFLVKLSLRILPLNEFAYLSSYFINPIITIIICEMAYWILKTKIPSLEKVLTGNR